VRRFAALLAIATIGAADFNTAARAAGTIPNVQRPFELEDLF
jgi:hypothetical protein